ncbi:ParA family protein [Thalassotalea euphylliae]|uniref:ParA family protein n=1 Tax=Thalassotalea euphylliae TaxID=1655234 RepID=A0A3E0UJE7_9GAMM|nr:ParA family protein [Thalassotalea euphylliae]REL36743.1 ParA family protein [Thalassotalea euphylliae]
MIRVLFNKKGGVGKSSLAVNLAAMSAASGLRTLVLDLDTQCNTSSYLSALDISDDDSIAALFEQTITFHLRKRPIIEYCQPTSYENLFIIRGSERIKELESELDSRHKIYKLRDALATLRDDFDRIYIDTPPALNFYSLSALIAADSCLIPIDCDDFARQGLYSLQQQIQEIKEDHNENLHVEGIIANQYMANANLPGRIIQELIDEGYPVIADYIPQSVKMRESHQQKSPLIHMAPKHKLTLAVAACYDFIEEQALASAQ